MTDWSQGIIIDRTWLLWEANLELMLISYGVLTALVQKHFLPGFFPLHIFIFVPLYSILTDTGAVSVRAGGPRLARFYAWQYHIGLKKGVWRSALIADVWIHRIALHRRNMSTVKERKLSHMELKLVDD